VKAGKGPTSFKSIKPANPALNQTLQNPKSIQPNLLQSNPILIYHDQPNQTMNCVKRQARKGKKVFLIQIKFGIKGPPLA
jgi:hypothetical protein